MLQVWLYIVVSAHTYMYQQDEGIPLNAAGMVTVISTHTYRQGEGVLKGGASQWHRAR